MLPESLEVVSDVEVNFRPSVVATDPSTEQRQVLSSGGMRELTLTLEDRNLKDTLHIRYFLDFNALMPTPHIAELDVPAPVNPMPGDFKRLPKTITVKCGTLTGELGMGVHVVTAFVADRSFINDGMPPFFRHLPADALTTEISWTLECS